MSVQDVISDSAIASAASKATYTGGSVAIYGGLTANDIAAFGGLAIAIIGLAVQITFKLRDDRRNAELHRERMARLRHEG